jgi:K+-sensing histidine kinase KdpD
MQQRTIIDKRPWRTLRTLALPLALSAILVLLATVGLTIVGHFFDLSLTFIPLVYLIPVIVAATRWGPLPALLTALLSTATADFFFYEPYYTFWVSDPHQVSDLILFLVVALVTGNLAARLRREADNSQRREIEVRDLYAFSRRLAGCSSIADIHAALQDFISNHLGLPAALIGADGGPDHDRLPGVPLPPQIAERAKEMLAADEFQSQLMVDAIARDAWLIRPLSPHAREYGVIVVDLGSYLHSDIESARQRIEAVLADVTETLNRLNIAKTIRTAKRRGEADLLKDVMIGSVSHELRNPLASILGSAGLLAGVPEIKGDDALSALAQATHEEAERLNGHVQKLLHATRVTADGMAAKLAWLEPTDLVNAALAQRSRRLAAHRVELELAPDLPLVEADGVLIEQALGELIENAAKYSAAGSTITVAARREDQHVVLSVSDQGAGLTTAERSQLFARPFRGDRHRAAVPGSGLGLWLASRFVAASRGTIHATSLGKGLGTTVSLHLPARNPVLAEDRDYADD